MVQVTLDTKVVTDAIGKGAAWVSSKLPSVASMQVGGNLLSVGMGAVAGYQGGRIANIADTFAKGFLSAMNGLSGGSVAKSIMKDVQDFRAASDAKAKGAVVLSGLTKLMGSVALITDAATTVVSRYVKSERFDTFVAVTKGLGAIVSLTAGREIIDLKKSVDGLSKKHKEDEAALVKKQANDRKAAIEGDVEAFSARISEARGLSSVIGRVGSEKAINESALTTEKHYVENSLENASQPNVENLSKRQELYEKLSSALGGLNSEFGKWTLTGNQDAIAQAKENCVGLYRALQELKNSQLPQITEKEGQERANLKNQQRVEMKNHTSYARPLQSIAYAFTAGLAAAKHFVPQNSYINRAYQVSVAASMLAGAAGIFKHSVPDAPMTLSNAPTALAFAGKV